MIAVKTGGERETGINLVTVDTELAGTSLTDETVRQPENFPNFAKWLYGYVKTLVEFMGQRSYKYHMNLTAGNIARQSTPNYLHMYMLASFENDVDSRVLADIYHDDKLKFIDHERIPFGRLSSHLAKLRSNAPSRERTERLKIRTPARQQKDMLSE
mgnify:CR=1 FL=1